MENSILEVQNLCVKFNESIVLHDVSFKISEGQFAVILGPNGAGKTTLLKAILGLIPFEGTIRIFGKDPEELTTEERLKIAYVPQRFEGVKSLPMTVYEFLSLSMQPGKRNIKDIINEFATVGDVNRLLSKQISHLSGGELQRVLIVRALLSKPKLMLFDEPFSGVDKIGERAFYEFLQYTKETYNVTILLVSHDVYNITKIADVAVCVNKRLVCFGTPESVFLEENFVLVFGEDVSTYKHKICKEGGPCEFYAEDESHNH
ncbi:metal ABC transporter ATP-binding protein [Caldisericum exile]|uniref:ABC transporter ATP-binding protein n=1 Tax=Caldisericum exile (strain DSM 21853 / NBRC 104410 / AZM16c01) TaxID=511051 RepID=A0A7U6GE19_CALEA|nr:metal ABC transporter ATP-binding protein [Caldisericum exile]BAL80669.1 ABC transporter ATP-binding protein [Caldisericum exile AZM16c01]